MEQAEMAQMPQGRSQRDVGQQGEEEIPTAAQGVTTRGHLNIALAERMVFPKLDASSGLPDNAHLSLSHCWHIKQRKALKRHLRSHA